MSMDVTMCRGMNKQIREIARKLIEERDLTHREVGESIGADRVTVTRLLSGKNGRIPENWQEILDLLDLELIAVKKVK